MLVRLGGTDPEAWIPDTLRSCLAHAVGNDDSTDPASGVFARGQDLRQRIIRISIHPFFVVLGVWH